MSTISNQKENKMGVMPVNKLVVSMSLPIVISMLVQALYNIVDSIFVSRLGENALTTLSLAFPIQNLMISVGVGTSIGINALLSRSLGERKQKQANLAATNGVFLAGVTYIIFAIFGLFFAQKFFETQTSDLEIIRYGTQYLGICTIFSFGIFMQLTYERIMQSTGNTFYTMLTQGLGAIINIILDPILIFGLFGLPKLEVAGAAIATVIGQICAMFLCIYLNHKKNKEVRISFKAFRPDLHTIKIIYMVGIPSIFMMSIASVMTFGFNKILLLYSNTATAVFGIYFKLQSFFFMPVFGINNGMVPIIAYNYGARNKKRLMDTLKISTLLAVGVMVIGLFIFQVFPRQLLELFNASDDMLAIGVKALRAISLSFVFAGFCIIVGSIFQALGNGLYSLIISFARQLILILPVAYILAKLFGLHAIWYSFPIAELASLFLTVLFFRRIYKEKISPLN